MRRGPSSIVRVLAVCARCGLRPDLYDIERHSIPLPMGDGKLCGHELAVCRSCRGLDAGVATAMERDALAVDTSSAVESMEFTQQWRADAARVQRTARYFLGAERAAELARATRETRERVAAENDRGMEQYRQASAARLFGAATDDDDDLPW